MNTTAMVELHRALRKLQLVLDGRYGGVDFTLWADPTQFADLPGAIEKADSRLGKVSEASRERAAIYFCLTASIGLLGVTLRLMSASTALSPRDRAERLRQMTEDLRTAARATYRAGLLLLGVDPCLPWFAHGASRGKA